MQHLVEEAILALTELDAGRLDRLLGELTLYQLHPPSPAEVHATLPGQKILGALLQETAQNLRLIERSSPCGISQSSIGTDVYPAAWQYSPLSPDR